MAVTLTELCLLSVTSTVVIYIFYIAKHLFAIFSAANRYNNKPTTVDKQSNTVQAEINSKHPADEHEKTFTDPAIEEIMNRLDTLERNSSNSQVVSDNRMLDTDMDRRYEEIGYRMDVLQEMIKKLEEKYSRLKHNISIQRMVDSNYHCCYHGPPAYGYSEPRENRWTSVAGAVQL